MYYSNGLETENKGLLVVKNSRSTCCKVCIGVTVLLVLIAIGIGAYVGYVLAGAGSPAIKTFGTNNFQVASTGISGTTTFSITNPNRVPITINPATLLIFYPPTNANNDQTQVGTSQVNSATVPIGATVNDTIVTNIAPTNSQNLGIAIGQALLGNAQNLQFRVNGTVTGSATVVGKFTVPVFLDCIFTMQIQNANNVTVTPNCTTTAGTPKIN